MLEPLGGCVSLVRVHNFAVSLDGFGTGEGQSFEAPFGHAEHRLHEWFFPTRTFRAMQGQPGGSTGIDDAFAAQWAPGIGAEIMGRNKFGYQRGPWTDEEWRGWGGANTPHPTPPPGLPHPPTPPPQRGGRGKPPALPPPRRGAPSPRGAATRDAGRHDFPLRRQGTSRGSRHGTPTG